MSPAHLHIVLAHMPIIGIFFGLVVLGIAYARSSNEIFRVSLVIFAISGLVAGIVYLLGDSAEEIVEDMAGISRHLIHEHEEAALYAMISGMTLGVVSAIGVWLSRTVRPKWLSPLVLILALFTAAVMAVTANRGGQINHPEIRTSTETDVPAGAGHQDDDDDD